MQPPFYKGYGMLERNDAKVSRSVLRRERASNRPYLVDLFFQINNDYHLIVTKKCGFFFISVQEMTASAMIPDAMILTAMAARSMPSIFPIMSVITSPSMRLINSE